MLEISKDELKQCGLHHACFREWFNLESIEGFKNVRARSTSSGKGIKGSTDRFTKNTSHFHGKFKKYSATLGGEAYILKVREEQYPELPGTEYLCNQIAKQLKIDPPPFYFVLFEEKVETFVTRNFMQDTVGNLSHIYTFLEKNDDFNCEKLMQVIAVQTKRLTELERFVDICLFDALIGNNDRHGRNLGLIQTKKGIELSPSYDNPSYLGMETEDLLGAEHEPYGAIFTKASKEPSMKDYVEEFKRLGHEEVIRRFYKRIEMNTLEELIKKAFISEKRKKAIQNLIYRRYGELKNAI